MRYIKKFATIHKAKGFILDDTNTPNVSLIEELFASTGRVRTTQKLPPHDYAADYFTIKVEETRKFHFAPDAGTISYSVDYGETWSEPSNDVTTPFVEAGDKILLKGNINYTTQGVDRWGSKVTILSPRLFAFLNDGDGGSDAGSDSASSEESNIPEIDPDLVGKYSIEGNLMSLFYGDGFNTPGTVAAGFAEDEDPTHVPGYDLTKALFADENISWNYAGPFSNLFQIGYYASNEDLISAKHLILPSKILSENCYFGMFGNCTSLTEIPELSATTLATCCYGAMFHSCTSLTTVPSNMLPWTELARSCYQTMFAGSGLINAPELPATTLADNCYSSMFWQCRSLTSAPELPATTLTTDCYHSMFNECTSLTTAPELPATTLARSCYEHMFYKCSSLTSAPALPATTLAQECYHSMFEECTSLTTAPALSATTLAQGCCINMFYGCTSLTTVPTDMLPATTLAINCYKQMFYDCDALTTAPELPATTLASNCYLQMFSNCAALTTAPELSATTLASSCYYGMFEACASLTTAPELPATTLATDCYHSMFTNCASLTTAPELPATTLVKDCYNNMFAYCRSLTTAPELPATTLADNCYRFMFSNCSSLNYIKCLATDLVSNSTTSYWLYNVALKGTFIKAASNNSWQSGYNGIPEGWTVQNA